MGHAPWAIQLTGITDDQRQDPDTFIRKLNFYCCDTLTAFLLAFLYLLHLGDRVVKIMEQRYNLVEFNRHTNNQLLRSLPGIEVLRDGLIQFAADCVRPTLSAGATCAITFTLLGRP